mmetsp:Transcript_41393/g.117097  ORF Transcript_41393/g.117097 Transcript_41393/m.117097 type:complete len:129 (+) Transcript_41393:108-494(+)
MLLSAVRHGRIPREIVFAVAKGMYGRSRRCIKLAQLRVMKELYHKYYLRHAAPRYMRTMWISRINPAAREHGINFSKFRDGLNRSQIHLDRKTLCNLAESEPISFKCLVDDVKRVVFPKAPTRDLSHF